MSVSDKVQLRLQMTSDQINQMNERIRANAPKEYSKSKRIYDEINRKVWDGYEHNNRSKGHWLYYSDQAREIAACKTERKHRRFWNKRAKAYRERSNTS